jgi:hypothetical protein
MRRCHGTTWKDSSWRVRRHWTAPGPERRRRWSIEQKQAIVTAAFGLMAPAGNGAAVPAVPAIEIEFAGSARVRISASVSPRDADHF